MEKVLIQTYGCTLNQADSDIMEATLRREGFLVERGEYTAGSAYDYVIVNTCTVKKPTEQKTLHRLREMRELGKRLIVTGCMAGANPDLVSKAAPDSSIVTTSNVHRIADAINEISKGGQVDYSNYTKTEKILYLDPNGSTIARIPISDGCLSSCSFCETKFARGPLNSYSEELILKAVKMAVGRGAREIELTSQDVGAYGADKRTDIAMLASNVTHIDGDFRVRIGMLNPEHLHKYIDRLIEAFKSEKLYRFIHLPVQSGSDKVLKDMSRNYTAEDFIGFVNEFKAKVPDISISTDMIVGYPTETKEDFEMSMQLIDKTRLSRINISKFGARPHARASNLMQLNNLEIKERCMRMYRLSRKIEMEALTKIVGTKVKVLLTEQKGDSILGRDASYREISVLGEGLRLGDFVNVNITGNTSVCLIGKSLTSPIYNQ